MGDDAIRPCVPQVKSAVYSSIGAGFGVAGPMWNRWSQLNGELKDPLRDIYKHFEDFPADVIVLGLLFVFFVSVYANTRVKHDNIAVCAVSGFGIPAVAIMLVIGFFNLSLATGIGG